MICITPPSHHLLLLHSDGPRASPPAVWKARTSCSSCSRRVTSHLPSNTSVLPQDQALAQKNVKVTVAALANDTVGTLMACRSARARQPGRGPHLNPFTMLPTALRKLPKICSVCSQTAAITPLRYADGDCSAGLILGTGVLFSLLKLSCSPLMPSAGTNIA